MDDMYREEIIEHYRNPQHYGTLNDPSFEAEGQNPLCGDELKVQALVDDDQTIIDVRFTGAGCAISQAAMSMLTDHIIGMKLDDVAAMTKEDVTDMLGIPLSPARLKCALLGLVVTKVGMNEFAGTALPAGFDGADEIAWTTAPEGSE